MLGTSNEIKNPGLRILPPGVERYFVKGGGLSVIEIFAEDKIDIINEEGKQICEIIVFDTNGKPDLSILDLKQNANADFSKRVIANDEKITKIFKKRNLNLKQAKSSSLPIISRNKTVTSEFINRTKLYTLASTSQRYSSVNVMC